MKSFKNVIAYIIGIISFVLIVLVSIVILSFLLNAIPWLTGLFNLSFGDFLYGIVLYGPALFGSLKIVEKISDKWSVNASAILLAMGITVILFSAVSLMINFIGGTSVYANIISLLVGVAFIFARDN